MATPSTLSKCPSPYRNGRVSLVLLVLALLFLVGLVVTRSGLIVSGGRYVYLRVTAAAGMASSQSALGRWALWDMGGQIMPDWATAAAYFRRAADQGDAGAQDNLARLLHAGLGVRKDRAEAIRLFHLAADQGSASAQQALGWIYEHGDGAPADPAQAVHYYGLAAAQNIASAQRALGWLHETGRGVL